MTTTDAIRVPQVNEQVENLRVNADDLTKMVATIESTLESVTTPSTPSAEKIQTMPAPTLVPLAMNLQEVCSQFRGAINRLRDLNSRVELASR